MLSRALSLATVTLLVGCFSVKPLQAQNLEAGKSPSQIFAGTCTACHKSPRGLLKTVPAGSLPSFLRQHYTTSGEMASLLSAFLVSNGAADTRYVGTQAKQAKDAKPEAGPSAVPDHIDRFGRRVRQPALQEAAKPEPEPQQALKPDAEGAQGRNAKRPMRPGEAPAADGQTPAQAALERGPDGRKQKLGKRGKPGSEESETAKTDAAKTEGAKQEPAIGEAAADDKAKEDKKDETAKDEGRKPEGTKPSGEDKSESAKIEAPKEQGSGEPPTLRADPVPPVTPAPSAASPAAVSAAVSGTAPESSASTSAPAAQAAPPAVTASVPPPPPIAPAGPPAPPISQ